jgi:hypothetical protein
VVIVASPLLISAFNWVAWNPVGNVTDNGWGEDPCEKDDMKRVKNGAGLIAIVRRTVCPGYMAGDNSLMYFVLIGVDQDDARPDLVLRYEPSDWYWDSPPYVAWDGPKVLRIAFGRISFGTPAIVQITKQEASSNGVTIEYSMLGKPMLPPALEFWERSFWEAPR